MTKDLSKRAREIIEKIKYVTIASITEDGLPWNSPLFSAYDEEFNFYWGTHKDSQKAKNIRANNNVFLAIYDSTVPPGTGEGVFVRAKVHQITDPDEVKRVYELLKARHAPAHFWEWGAIQEG